MPDEFVLLCETCGYDIESLPRDGACPECGRVIANSLPAARDGTPWQRKGKGLRAILATWHAILTRPRATFSAARICATHSELLGTTILAAGLTIGVGFFGRLATDRLEVLWTTSNGTWRTDVIADLLMILLVSLPVTGLSLLLLVLLTLVEERGIRFWGPRRGWRITPTIAQVICAHASVGWVLGSVLAVVGHIVGWGLLEITNRHNVNVLRGPMQLAPITLPALGLLIGMLTFEVLVYIGMGRMKFANRERPDPSERGRPGPAAPTE